MTRLAPHVLEAVQHAHQRAVSDVDLAREQLTRAEAAR